MFETIRNIFTGSATARPRTEASGWLRDPLSHPVLDRMTPDELADLPLGLVRFADNQNGYGKERLCA
jgi:hypothetical protein